MSTLPLIKIHVDTQMNPHYRGKQVMVRVLGGGRARWSILYSCGARDRNYNVVTIGRQGNGREMCGVLCVFNANAKGWLKNEQSL